MLPGPPGCNVAVGTVQIAGYQRAPEQIEIGLKYKLAGKSSVIKVRYRK